MFSSYKHKIDINELKPQLPLDLGVLLTRYVDPFVNNGKMYYEIMSYSGMEDAVICDKDPEIINIYKVVKTNPESLIENLRESEDKFNYETWEEKRILYKSNLGKFSYIKGNNDKKLSLLRASILIFLIAANKYFKENYDNIIEPELTANPIFICPEEKIRKMSDYLSVTKIIQGDFNECLPYVNKRTFMIVNPKPPLDPRTLKAVESFNKIASYKGAEIIFNYPKTEY